MNDDEAAILVRSALGPDYTVARVSGYWIIGRTPGFQRVSPAPLRRSLRLAIEDVRAGASFDPEEERAAHARVKAEAERRGRTRPRGGASL